MSKKKLKGFKPYLFDFLVIVLGVTVSFWFNQLAIKRLGEFRDISNVIDFFIDEKSDFITGQTIFLGGV